MTFSEKRKGSLENFRIGTLNFVTYLKSLVIWFTDSSTQLYGALGKRFRSTSKEEKHTELRILIFKLITIC
jgi:hypothetical protein